MTLEYRIMTSLPSSHFAAVETLYRDAGWWHEDYDTAWLADIPRGSACFAAVFDGELMVGMGRALSDNVSDAYIQDIAVLKSYRGLGIGSDIVRFLIQTLKARGVDWIALIGEPGTEKFYIPLGFQKMEQYVPMKWSDPDL